MSATLCEACGGKRLKPEALAVKIAGSDIGDATALSVRDAHAWFGALPEKLSAKQNEIAVRILKEIRDRLTFLVDVGLEYLTLARGSACSRAARASASVWPARSGQASRAFSTCSTSPRSACISATTNACSERQRLRDLGNTVIVVEHDEDAILQADYVFDIGPGAGIHGGEIVAEGTPDEVMANPDSSPASISKANCR